MQRLIQTCNAHRKLDLSFWSTNCQKSPQNQQSEHRLNEKEIEILILEKHRTRYRAEQD